MGLRNRIKYNLSQNSYFFVTTTVEGYRNIFTNDIYCNILIKNIKHYQIRYRFTLYGYVIMPTHFHMLIEINSVYGTLSDIMRDIKKYSAWDILEQLEKDKQNILTEYFGKAAEGINYQKRKFWMHRFDDEFIRDEKMFYTKLSYIHNNPVKAGLVKTVTDYKYGSARNYYLNDQSIINIETKLN